MAKKEELGAQSNLLMQPSMLMSNPLYEQVLKTIICLFSAAFKSQSLIVE
jgi:hypothetical protein